MFKRKRFSSKTKEKWYKQNLLAICIALVVISGLSIGYSAFSEKLNVMGTLALRVEKDIRVDGLINKFSSCGTDVYNPIYNEDSITVNGELPSLECYLEYEVTINNTTDFVMEVTEIDDTIYSNSDVSYNMNSMSVGTLISANDSKTFIVKLFYDSTLSVLPSDTTISAIFKFKFDYADIVIYDNKFIEPGLILLYDGKNNSGQGYRANATKWKDLIGTNDGELIGDPKWTNGYLNFDGIDDKVEFIGNTPTNYTIISTFYNDPSHSAPYQRIWADNPFPSLCLLISGSNRHAWLYGHGVDVVFPNAIRLHGVIQAAMTFNGSKIDLYVNGQLVSSIARTSIAPSVQKAFLGGRGTDDLRQFKGKMYNFMIYDRVLNDTEIKHNYDVHIENKAIPIQTVEEFLKIGSNEVVEIDGEAFLFSHDANYVIENDLAFDYDGIWTPVISQIGSIISNDKVVTITNTNDGSIRYFQNQLFVTKDNAINDGLVLHYDGLNNTGTGNSNSSSIWKDLKGNNDATLIGGTTWNGKSLEFDGLTGKVAYKGNITPVYSIVMTIKPDPRGSHPRLTAENGFPTIYLHSGAGNNYALSFYAQGQDRPFNPMSWATIGEPTYVVVTYDSATVRLYINGVYNGAITTTTAPSSATLAYLGGRAANDRQYKGLIYDFMIYDRALTVFEIDRSYLTNYAKYPN